MTADALVVVRGGGDLGTGVAHRLVRSGYRVVVLERESPRAVRRLVAFAQAVIDGEVTVEGVPARRAGTSEIPPARADAERPPAEAERPPAEAERPPWEVERPPGETERPWVPVVADPDGASLSTIRPDVVVDARMAKRNLGTTRDDAPLTVALGPGFEAGADVDIVIETRRGHSLGKVIEEGTALPDTGVPGEVEGVSSDRLLRAPATGALIAKRSIGDLVTEGQEVATVAGRAVLARTSGVVRGLIAGGTRVTEGEKVGDIDPRGDAVDPGAISDKARAVGGAVLEALLSRGMMPGGEV